jgi:hypothetical protein
MMFGSRGISKSWGTFARDFGFGFAGNFMSGYNPGVKVTPNSTFSWANEAAMDLIFINLNIGLNNTYDE